MPNMDAFPDNVFVRVCHVKTHTDREAHIVAELNRHGVPVNFHLDHDIPDLTDEMIANFAKGNVSIPNISLAFKHYYIWKDFLASGKPYCLVLEDDVFLADGFVEKLKNCLVEFGDPDRFAVIYLGNGGNYYTPKSQLQKGRHLYPSDHCRCTDSYVITRSVAQARCDWFDQNKVDRPIDHHVNEADWAMGTEILWYERPIAEQGTHNGTFQSTVGTKRRPLWYKRIEWTWKKYRRMARG